jgi:hypothetical protein
LEKLNSLALETKEKFQNKFEELYKANQDLFPKYSVFPEIEFINGDFLKQNWKDASVILANSTCFSGELMLNLSKKAEEELAPGAIIITFTKRLPNLSENWEIRDGFRRLMSWGIATVYVHIKKKQQ